MKANAFPTPNQLIGAWVAAFAIIAAVLSPRAAFLIVGTLLVISWPFWLFYFLNWLFSRGKADSPPQTPEESCRRFVVEQEEHALRKIALFPAMCAVGCAISFALVETHTASVPVRPPEAFAVTSGPETPPPMPFPTPYRSSTLALWYEQLQAERATLNVKHPDAVGTFNSHVAEYDAAIRETYPDLPAYQRHAAAPAKP